MRFAICGGHGGCVSSFVGAHGCEVAPRTRLTVLALTRCPPMRMDGGPTNQRIESKDWEDAIVEIDICWRFSVEVDTWFGKQSEAKVTSMGRASRILREDGDREERGRKIKPSRHHNKRSEYEVERIVNRDQDIRTIINAIGNPRTNRVKCSLFSVLAGEERSLALFGMARLLTIHHVT